MVVADASVLIEALLYGRASEQRLAGEDICCPHLVDIEVVSALRMGVLRSRISPERARQAIDDFAGADILRYDHSNLIDRAWELRGNVTPYDGVYVALAEWLDVPLVTTDARLAAAPGIKATVEVLPVG